MSRGIPSVVRTSAALPARVSAPPRVTVVVMGVSGSGKTTVGTLLAQTLRCPFLDADDFHPPSNKAKMQSGIPLTDEDRIPWMLSLCTAIRNHLTPDASPDSLHQLTQSPSQEDDGAGTHLEAKSRCCMVLACSALKPAYRRMLRGACLGKAQDPGAGSSGGVWSASGEGVTAVARHATAESGALSGSAGLPGLGGSPECQQIQEQQQIHEPAPVRFILLQGPVGLFVRRVAQRKGHFMPASLLQSQMDTLCVEEGEEDVVKVDASLAPGVLVELVLEKLNLMAP